MVWNKILSHSLHYLADHDRNRWKYDEYSQLFTHLISLRARENKQSFGQIVHLNEVDEYFYFSNFQISRCHHVNTIVIEKKKIKSLNLQLHLRKQKMLRTDTNKYSS